MELNQIASQAVAPQKPSGPAPPPVPSSRSSDPPPKPAPKAQAKIAEHSEGQARGAGSALLAHSSESVRNGSRIHFDEATEQIVIEIINKNREVIRQLPPDAALRIAARFREITGLIFDQQV